MSERQLCLWAPPRALPHGIFVSNLGALNLPWGPASLMSRGTLEVEREVHWTWIPLMPGAAETISEQVLRCVPLHMPRCIPALSLLR